MSFLNPNLYEIWRDEETGDPRIFEGRAYLKYGRLWKINIPELRRSFDLERASGSVLVDQGSYQVKLRFHLGGPKAEIVNHPIPGN